MRQFPSGYLRAFTQELSNHRIIDNKIMLRKSQIPRYLKYLKNASLSLKISK